MGPIRLIGSLRPICLIQSRLPHHSLLTLPFVLLRMAAMPPAGESNYPRPDLMPSYGTADKLEALSEGYFGLNRVFLLNFVLLIVAGVFNAVLHMPLMTLALLGVLFILSGVLSYGPNAKIAAGRNRPATEAVLGSILIAFFCWLCFGALGYLVMQSMATNEMKRYGLKIATFGGLKKPALQAAVAELRAAEARNQAMAATTLPTA